VPAHSSRCTQAGALQKRTRTTPGTTSNAERANVKGIRRRDLRQRSLRATRNGSRRNPGAPSRASWCVAFIAAFLAHFTAPVYCELSPDVCCAGEALSATTPPAPSTTKIPGTEIRDPSCGGCCDAEPADASSPPLAARNDCDPDGRPLANATNRSPCPTPLKTCGCERDRGTTVADYDSRPTALKSDGSPGTLLFSALPLRSFVVAPPRGSPRRIWPIGALPIDPSIDYSVPLQI